MASNLRVGPVLDAVNLAIYIRRPARRLIHHSYGGIQYTLQRVAMGMGCMASWSDRSVLRRPP
jgi:hypothetical protein